MIPRLALAISLALCSTAAVAQGSATDRVYPDPYATENWNTVCRLWELDNPQLGKPDNCPPLSVLIDQEYGRKSTPHPDAKPLLPDGLKDVPDGMYAVYFGMYWKIPGDDNLRCYAKRGPAITEIPCPKEVK